MALDQTAKIANVKDSIKKYFVDNFQKNQTAVNKIPLTFDRQGLSEPKIQGQPVEIAKWVVVDIGTIFMDTLSTVDIDIICCTKKDPEGYQLNHLRDRVMSYLIDSTVTTGSGIRIPFYRSRAQGAWTLLGNLVVTRVRESRELVTEDGTKYKVIYVELRWGTKV